MDQLACAASENAIVPQDAAFLEEDPLRWLHILEVNMIWCNSIMPSIYVDFADLLYGKKLEKENALIG